VRHAAWREPCWNAGAPAGEFSGARSAPARTLTRSGAATAPSATSPTAFEARASPLKTFACTSFVLRAGALRAGKACGTSRAAGCWRAPECAEIARAGAPAGPDPSENVPADREVTPSAVRAVMSPSRRAQCLDNSPSPPAASAQRQPGLRPWDERCGRRGYESMTKRCNWMTDRRRDGPFVRGGRQIAYCGLCCRSRAPGRS